MPETAAATAKPAYAGVAAPEMPPPPAPEPQASIALGERCQLHIVEQLRDMAANASPSGIPNATELYEQYKSSFVVLDRLRRQADSRHDEAGIEAKRRFDTIEKGLAATVLQAKQREDARVDAVASCSRMEQELRRARERIAALEKQKNPEELLRLVAQQTAELAELAKLRARVAELEEQGSPAQAQELAKLRARVAELEAQGSPAQAQELRQLRARLDARAAEPDKRNRLLALGVEYLKLVPAGAAQEKRALLKRALETSDELHDELVYYRKQTQELQDELGNYKKQNQELRDERAAGRAPRAPSNKDLLLAQVAENFGCDADLTVSASWRATQETWPADERYTSAARAQILEWLGPLFASTSEKFGDASITRPLQFLSSLDIVSEWMKELDLCALLASYEYKRSLAEDASPLKIYEAAAACEAAWRRALGAVEGMRDNARRGAKWLDQHVDAIAEQVAGATSATKEWEKARGREAAAPAVLRGALDFGALKKRYRPEPETSSRTRRKTEPEQKPEGEPLKTDPGLGPEPEQKPEGEPLKTGPGLGPEPEASRGEPRKTGPGLGPEPEQKPEGEPLKTDPGLGPEPVTSRGEPRKTDPGLGPEPVTSRGEPRKTGPGLGPEPATSRIRRRKTSTEQASEDDESVEYNLADEDDEDEESDDATIVDSAQPRRIVTRAMRREGVAVADPPLAAAKPVAPSVIERMKEEMLRLLGGEASAVIALPRNANHEAVYLRPTPGVGRPALPTLKGTHYLCANVRIAAALGLHAKTELDPAELSNLVQAVRIDKLTKTLGGKGIFVRGECTRWGSFLVVDANTLVEQPEYEPIRKYIADSANSKALDDTVKSISFRKSTSKSG